MLKKLSQVFQQQPKLYRYQGVNKQGEFVRDCIAALQRRNAKIMLQQRDITLISLHRQRQKQTNQRIKQVDITDFLQQLRSFLLTGYAIDQALCITARHLAKFTLQRLIYTLAEQVSQGQALSTAMSKHPLYFDDMTTAMIRVGEHNGNLAGLLQAIIEQREQQAMIRKQFLKALFYPAIVCATALIIIVLLMVFAVPQFESMFQDFGSKLPALTQTIIAVAHNLPLISISSATSVGCIIMLYRLLKRRQSTQQKLHRILLKIPLLGNLLQQQQQLNWLNTLLRCLNSGLPLLQALAHARSTISNNYLHTQLQQAQQRVEQGLSLSQALAPLTLFDERIVQAIEIGENSQQFIATLQQTVLQEQARFTARIEKLLKSLEPLFMLFIASLVGLIVVGMYLPIFKMGGAV